MRPQRGAIERQLQDMGLRDGLAGGGPSLKSTMWTGFVGHGEPVETARRAGPGGPGARDPGQTGPLHASRDRTAAMISGESTTARTWSVSARRRAAGSARPCASSQEAAASRRRPRLDGGQTLQQRMGGEALATRDVVPWSAPWSARPAPVRGPQAFGGRLRPGAPSASPAGPAKKPPAPLRRRRRPSGPPRSEERPPPRPRTRAPRRPPRRGLRDEVVPAAARGAAGGPRSRL